MNRIHHRIIGTFLLCLFFILPVSTVFAQEDPKKTSTTTESSQNAKDNSAIKLLAPIGEKKTIDIPKPDAKGGYTILIVEDYLRQIYPYLTMIIIAITVLMTVVGSIEIMTAGGDSGKVTAGKDRIMYALIGLLIFLFASAILWTINPNFFTWQ